jgi:RimJ/RimL family protein N-acetyltransferase
MLDFEQLQSWIPDKEFLMQFAGPRLTFPLTKEQIKTLLSNSDWLVFKFVDNSTGMAAGHGEINISGFPNILLGRLLIGKAVMRRVGLGEQLVKLLLDYAFNTLKAESAELNVFDFNKSAIRCYTKCGFKMNAEKVKTTEINGNIWTLHNMRVNRSEWLALTGDAQ